MTPTSAVWHYPRPALAQALADDLLGLVAFSDAPNGLFLSAPRRTGKSEFLQQDLKPELERRGITVVYVDLWSDKTRSPMDLIAGKLGEAMVRSLGLVEGLAKKAGLTKLTIPGTGFSFDLSQIGKVDGLTLPQALALLREQTKYPVAVMVDEAQHALVSEQGESAMSALKSARDQLRDQYGPLGQAGLLLVMSGSHRDKLMRLLDTPSTPFWGSKVKRLPGLDAGFVAREASKIRAIHPALLSLQDSVLQEAFDRCGEQPQAFGNLIARTLGIDTETAGAVRTPWSGDANSFVQKLQSQTQSIQELEHVAMRSAFVALSKPQQAVLAYLLTTEKMFKAFDAKALAFYEAHAGEKMTASKVQKVLESLVKTDPPLIWRSLRGEYALYDQAWQSWYIYCKGLGKWPI